MYMLSKKDELANMGSTREVILEKLNITGRNKGVYFRNLITELSDYVNPIGLEIQFNPLNARWFLTFKSNMSELISANPFQDKPRLASTLLCAIMLCLKNNSVAKISEIQKLRNKKDIVQDLSELESAGYISKIKDSNDVKLTPLIGYQLNLEKLFMKLSLKLSS